MAQGTQTVSPPNCLLFPLPNGSVSEFQVNIPLISIHMQQNVYCQPLPELLVSLNMMDVIMILWSFERVEQRSKQ